MNGGGFSMDSIPLGVKKTIQDIKEISRIHTEEEIYTMLQECSMDPNETVQKLLSQDTFHEVKRKRDRKKESMNNREPADSRWKQGMQRRDIRSGRGTYSSRYISHDSGVTRNFNAGKENGISQVPEKGSPLASSLGTHATENDSGVPSSSFVPGVTNGPTKSALVGSSLESGSQMPDGGGSPFGEESSIAEAKSENAVPPPVDSKTGPENVVGVMHARPVQSSYQFPSPGTGMQASVSGVYASATDPVLVPSLETRAAGVVGSIKREVLSERSAVEPAAAKVASNVAAGSEISSGEEAPSEMGSSSIQGKLLAKSQVVDVNNLSDATQPSSSSSQFGSSGGRPSPNYGSRMQQIIGPHKVGPSKEWKPKPTSQVPTHVSGTIGTSDVVSNTVDDTQSSSGAPEEATSKLQKKMEELHFSDDKHVIIPNHLQVPESERTGFSFGSFDANFTLGTRFLNGPSNENCSMPLTDLSQVPEEIIEEPTLSTQNVSTAQEEDFADDPQSPSQMPQNLSSGDGDVSSLSAVSEYDQNKHEAPVAEESPQFSVVHTAPTYSTFGLVPPMVGNQFAPFETSEPQGHDAPPLPSFVVQQPFDPSTGYYTQIYPPGGDNSGRFSPFLSPDTAAKYNGNLAILPSQAGQTSQESANSIVLPATGPTPVVTQAVGVMQTSLAVTQQPVPVFRQPAGVHIPHYTPNYMPYQYFSPVYVPPPTIQHFLSNAAFLQQPLPGSIYPPPAAPTTTPVKNSLSQYKTGTNSGNSTHSGMPTGYGPYGSTPTGYSPSPAVTSGNSTGNEDITGPQYKENDVYITGQQSEGSAVWVPAPGRDIPSMQTSSLYNLPPQGQHMTFTPLQAGHSAFNGIYHPTQSVAAASVHPLLQPSQTMASAVEMVGRPSGVYQQPQRAQINWASNY